jgi:hypothetical protein
MHKAQNQIIIAIIEQNLLPNTRKKLILAAESAAI